MKKTLQKLLTALLLSVLLTGCSVDSLFQSESKDEVAQAPTEEISLSVEILVTQENGDIEISTQTFEIEEGQTVMDVMKDNFEIETQYDGTFISSINGIKAEDGESFSWFYSVNGEEAMVGANEYELSNGDVVEFDFHSWE